MPSVQGVHRGGSHEWAGSRSTVPRPQREHEHAGNGLKELRAAGEIDERLYEWGVELNAKRNIAAHPDPTPISEQDARYVFEFVLAICDYVYVLTAKFERFKAGE